MQQKSISKKRIILGVLLLVLGLTLVVIVAHPLHFQAPINVLFPSLITIFLYVVLIIFGGFVLGIGLRPDLQKDFKIFLIAIVLVGVWTFAVALPIMLLSLPEEISVLTMSFSWIPFVLVIGYFEKWSKKRKERRKKEVERKAEEA